MSSSSNDDESVWIGVIGVLVASCFWGSNFIVCKGYDGIPAVHFAFLMSIGIVLVGAVTMFFAPIQDGDFVIVLAPLGLLGGAIWATGNFLTVPIIWHLGLGVGLSTWVAVNIIVAFCVGTLGLEGIGLDLPPEDLTRPGEGIVGVGFAICGLVALARIQASSDGDRKKKNDGDDDVNQAVKTTTQKQSLVEVENGQNEGQIVEEATSIHELSHDANEMNENDNRPLNAPRNTTLGIVLAVIAGTLFGFQFVPLSMWNAKVIDNGHIFGEEVTSEVTRSLRFFFSQFLGIFLTSSVVLFGYALLVSKKKCDIQLVPPQATIPSIISGAVWGIGCAGAMFATSGLGNAVGFPLVLNGTFLVNSSWSVFYFAEIRGTRNLCLYAAAFCFIAISSILISLSKA